MNFLTPAKEKAGRFLARTKDRCNEAVGKLRHSTTDLTSPDSDICSPPKTPVVDEETTLADFFKSADLPSPPRGDLKMRDVNEQLKILYPNFAQLRDSDIAEENERFCKLVYAVGKGFFDHLVVPRKAGTNARNPHIHSGSIALAQGGAKAIIDRCYDEGKRFHTLFSAYDAGDRQWTIGENDGKKMGIREYEYYIQYQRLSGVLNFRKDRKADIYEVFNDKVSFPNLKTQYRVQDQGNCFVQAAILQHFYLQLVHNKQLMKNDAYISDLSRFMRNFYEGKLLYNYIIDDEGGSFLEVLQNLLDGDYDVPEEFGDLTFDGYVAKLKSHGPAIIKMFIGDDFKQKNQYRYDKTPPHYADNKKEGHAMLLVGVMRVGKDADLVAGTDLYFILQNFWQDKQFVMVRRDYFRACSVSQEGGTASVNFVVYNGEFVSASPDAIYAKKAEHDVSLSSHLLERPSSAKRMLKIRSVDSTGHRHTRWE